MYVIPAGHTQTHSLRVKYMWRGQSLQEDFLRGDPGEGEPVTEGTYPAGSVALS